MGSRERLAWVRHAAPIVVLVLAVVALGFVPPRPHGTITPLADWQYRLSEPGSQLELSEPWASPRFAPLKLPAHPAGSGEVLWLRTRIPRELPPDAVLAIDAVLGAFTAYVGSDRVFAFPEPDGVAARGSVGLPWQLIPLPAGSEGKTLSLCISAHYRPLGVKGTPLFGSRADLMAWTLERDLPRLVVGFVAILLGLLGFVSFSTRQAWRLPFSFAVWAAALGVYVIHYTHLKDLIADVSVVSFFAWLLALPAMVVGSLLFLDELFVARSSKVLRWLLRASLLFTPLYLLALTLAWVLTQSTEHAALGVSVFALATNAVRIVILVSSLLVLVEASRFASAGDLDARIFLVGFGFLLAFAVRDVMAAFGTAMFSWRSQVHVGALACVVAMAISVQRRYVALHERARLLAEEAVARGRERDALVRDLHDGVGAMTSNIRMLAELGQRKAERAQPALETIAELSEKSLAELRAYVHTLDDAEATWERHVAELRRFGASLVEAHGRAFEMQVDVGTQEAPPMLLGLHLLRTFSEGLTNALKRSNGSYVKVELSVHPDALSLSMENDGDGVADASRSIGGGRGLENLRSRAAELGGEFRIEIGKTNRLLLRVPLPLSNLPALGRGAALKGTA